jgi:hypothetical protein
VDDPILLHGDNKGFIDLSLNPVTKQRSKHMNIKHYVICKYIKNAYISIICTLIKEIVTRWDTNSVPGSYSCPLATIEEGREREVKVK